jgi:hypothetical protein
MFGIKRIINFIKRNINKKTYVEIALNNTSENIITKRYPLFTKILTNKYIPIPNLDTNFIPQGICQADDYYVITAYDKMGLNNSKIYLIDKNGVLERTIEMDSKYHVGGVSFYKKTQMIYVSASKNVHAYKLGDLLRGKVVPIVININTGVKGHYTSYLNITNNYIYVGEFGTKGNSFVLRRYQLNSEGLVDNSLFKEYSVPYLYTQGMTVFEYKNEFYYIFSCSYRNIDSSLYISKQDGNTFKTIKCIKIPPMSEGVSITNNKKLLIIFESGSSYFKKVNIKCKSAMILDIKKIIDDISII